MLASQEGAVRALVNNTGVVFNALAGRDHQLEGRSSTANTPFTRPRASQAFEEAFRALPRSSTTRASR